LSANLIVISFLNILSKSHFALFSVIFFGDSSPCLGTIDGSSEYVSIPVLFLCRAFHLRSAFHGDIILQ